MKKILFLGYGKKSTKLIDEIRFYNKNFYLKQTAKKIGLKDLKKFDSIISFGYRYIINKEIIKKLNVPIINLHIGYLPFNRGAHPNFWAFAENTPSGVSIHKIDSGIDTGKIINQKIVDFELLNNKKYLTFANTYKKLLSEIENLFLLNINKLINYNFVSYKQIGKGSFHEEKDLPKLLKGWNQNIYKTVVKYNNLKEKEINEKLLILNQIENTRKSNNLNWMNIVRTSLKSSPKNTLNLLKKINFDDNKISHLFKSITK
jgi:folate-dependent phosphoribosylglycinamide formyltransferase PurN